MTGRLRSVLPGLLVATVATAALLGSASSASADDIYEIDGRLQEAGFDEAFTEAFSAADRPGVRIVIDFASGSADEAAYEREAEQAAELVWDHLDGRLLAVDVAPTYDAEWAEDGLPTARSFDRATLIERFGTRPAGLDAADVETFDDEGLAFLGAAVAGWLVSLLVVGLGTFFLTRARYRRPSPAASPEHWGGMTGPPGAWSSPATWPPPASPPAHQQSGAGSAQPAPDDPWRPLG